MPVPSRPKLRALLPGGLALLVLLAGCHRRQPAPNVDGLTEILKQSAEKMLPDPSLGNEQIVVSAKPLETEARVTEILNAAVAAGGTGIKTVQDGNIAILANIPEGNEAIFKGLLRHENVTRPAPAASPGGMRLIEVQVQVSGTASPAAGSALPTPP